MDRVVGCRPTVSADLEEKRTIAGLERSAFLERLVVSHLVYNTPIYAGDLPQHLVPKRHLLGAENAKKMSGS